MPGMGAGKRWQPEREAGKVPHPGHNQGWVLTPGIILPQRHEGSTPPALLTGSLSLETRWCSVRNASLLAAICSPSQAFLGAGRRAGVPPGGPSREQRAACHHLPLPSRPPARLSPPPLPCLPSLQPSPASSLPFSACPLLSSLSFPVAVSLPSPGLPNSSHLCPTSRAQHFLLGPRPSLQKPFSGQSSPSSLWTVSLSPCSLPPPLSLPPIIFSI